MYQELVSNFLPQLNQSNTSTREQLQRIKNLNDNLKILNAGIVLSAIINPYDTAVAIPITW